MKVCYTCKKYLGNACFYKDKSKKDGLLPTCKNCIRIKKIKDLELHPEKIEKRKIYDREYAKKNRDKKTQSSKEYAKKNRDKILYNSWKWSLKKFGLNPKDFEKMKMNQDNKCAICKDDFSDMKRRPFVDHNHKTGKVRGLLCHFCNIGLGVFNDDITKLRNAIKYLKEN